MPSVSSRLPQQLLGTDFSTEFTSQKQSTEKLCEVLKLYYFEINELLKYSADSSAFVGHKRLLSAECPNLGDLVPLRYTRATRFSNI